MTVNSLLKKLQTRPDAVETLNLLRELAAAAHSPKSIEVFHDQLLFYKAYPQSEAIRKFCDRELGRFHERIEEMGLSEDLAQTGIAGTEYSYAFDYSNARVLSDLLGKDIELDWEDYESREDPLVDILWLLLEDCEADAADSEDLTVREILERAAGNRTVISLLLECFERTFEPRAAAQIYNDANLTLRFKLVGKAPSRSTVADKKPAALFLWDPREDRSKFKFAEEILRPLTLPAPSPHKRAQDLLNIVHGTLLIRSREYYGATHGNPDDFYEIPLDRGATLLFWFAKPEWRLPQETGLGFVLLKNGVPISYGGGGAHPARLEIAVNLFDTFRGGEAAWVYAQLIRAARAFYHAPWCVARKYQVGHENEEGLASGSYWFYYKLGFRSTDAKIRRLAESERKKILKQKGYRSPKSVLKQLAEADVVLPLEGQDPADYHEFPLDRVSLLATDVLTRIAPRDRKIDSRILKAVEALLGFPIPQMSANERHSVAQQGLFLLAHGKCRTWPDDLKHTWLRMARGKGSAHEANYLSEVMTLKDYFGELAELSLKHSDLA
ncbi:hypothetical protein HUU59_11770 [bacterium]|nr:hypothetical protein [bacterium]